MALNLLQRIQNNTHKNQQRCSSEELGKALFGTYMEADRRSVMVNVSRLRKRFDDNHELSNHIETVWGKGYRFIIATYHS